MSIVSEERVYIVVRVFVINEKDILTEGLFLCFLCIYRKMSFVYFQRKFISTWIDFKIDWVFFFIRELKSWLNASFE